MSDVEITALTEVMQNLNWVIAATWYVRKGKE